MKRLKSSRNVQKQAEEDLRRAKATAETANRELQGFHRFFEMSLDMLCIAGVDGFFKRVNPAFNALGYTPEELLSRPFLDFVHQDDRPSTLAEVEKLSRGIPTIYFENRYRCKDGSYRWLAWTSAPDETGTLFAIARDMTVQKQAEGDLRRAKAAAEAANQELARSNAELEQFAYIASHDLQEPLRMVASFVQILEEEYKGKLDANADKYIHYAVDGAVRMQRLIEDLLEYSRVTTMGRPLETTNAEAVLSLSIENLSAAVSESGAIVTHDPMPIVLADQTQLMQVFQNLIGNAIKFRGETAPEIHIGADRQGAEWVFSVKDNGIGIKPRYYEKIFVLFQRLHGREKYAGTGIGLAVCKKIVERHGGRIWVESREGEGTTFYFTLRAAEEGGG